MNAKDRIGKIVVGIDGSESATEAVAWTIDLARQTGAEIVAVSALAPPNYAEYAGMAMVAPIEFDPQFQAELESAFRQDWCRPLIDSGLAYRAVFAQGRPAAVLATVAEAEGADLVVVGRRGRGGFAELVLGSVSHELTHHCSIPVVLISHHKVAKHHTVALAGASSI
jgi:nucleotide-binding universal stress UspA family protein